MYPIHEPGYSGPYKEGEPPNGLKSPVKTLFFRPLPYNYYYPPRILSSLTLAILPLTSLRVRNTFRMKPPLFEQAEITTTLGIV